MESINKDIINKQVHIADTKELEFAIFCIENISKKLQTDATQVYDALKDSNILYGYIIPEYEVLHTQSKEYIIEELLEIMKERSINL